MNLEEEIRNGYVVASEKKKVWAVELKLLHKLLSVCEEYNLKIWADGGTLLGTVRHKGFIPWDDDIDMVMLRDDYDKLLQIASKEFTHPFFFQCAYTEKIYPRGHSQLRMDGTAAVLNGVDDVFSKTHQGIFIDIFPYDVVPDNSSKRTKLIDKRNRLMDIICHVAPFDYLHPLRSLWLYRYRSKFVQIYSKFEDIFREEKIDDNNYLSCLSYKIDFDHFLRDKQWYKETLFLPFEDVKIPVPAGYHDILALQYGEDYMVPKMMPSDHGDFMILDADKSFTDYDLEIKVRCRLNRRNAYSRRIKSVLKRLT